MPEAYIEITVSGADAPRLANEALQDAVRTLEGAGLKLKVARVTPAPTDDDPADDEEE